MQHLCTLKRWKSGLHLIICYVTAYSSDHRLPKSAISKLISCKHLKQNFKLTQATFLLMFTVLYPPLSLFVILWNIWVFTHFHQRITFLSFRFKNCFTLFLIAGESVVNFEQPRPPAKSNKKTSRHLQVHSLDCDKNKKDTFTLMLHLSKQTYL